MQRYKVASQINVAPGVGQVARKKEAFGLVILCLVGPILNWYNTHIKSKNWRCNNLLDNLDIATLTAVRTIGAGNSDEDWSIASSEPTNNALVAPNASRGFSAITIVSGIKLEQLLYLFSTSYMIVKYLKQIAVFGQLMQGDMAQQNADLQSTIKSFQETMSRVTKTLDNSKKSSKKRAENIGINHFLSNLLRKNPGKHPANEYNHVSIKDISDSLAELILNSIIKTAETIHKVLQSELN
ncbi:9566_t:CDS:2 [Gigaspora margarita]|uniref:9566_t:CDS:1 n=1 Tax=Gigaspora margarita TaxID=4874 RepID=A0ABN7VIA5_GIGMA|nr:9566_t:CDS:2 [Gigaspora margarita]